MKRPEGFDPTPQANPPRRRQPEPGKRAQPAQRPQAGPAKPPRAARATGTREPRPSQADARVRARLERAETRRFTRRSRRRRLAWLGVAGVLLVLVGVLAVAIFSPILALRTIRVEGASVVKASAVRSALSSQLGTPLALLNDATIRHELGQFVLIRSYVTEVVPPNTLVVRIVERQAIGVVQYGAGYDQVDPAGVVLTTSTTPAGLPVIDIGSARVGGAAFAAAVKVLLAMPTPVLDEVKSISASSLDNVSLTLTSGNHTVLWGSSSQSDLKATALAWMLSNPRCKSLAILNVTAPTVLGCSATLPTPSPTSTP